MLGGSLLSQPLKDHLRDQLRRLGHARLLFGKRPERRSYKRRMLYVGSCRPGEEQFYALEFDHHDDLVGYDFASALLEGGTPGVPVEHPLFVVCTHGKRDRCCAKYGRPLYDQLKGKVDPEWVWQSTHVGGDRFAGNALCLPHGVYYGRVDRDDVPGLVDEYFEGRISLAHYRGRSCWPFAVQAAERRIRAEEGLTGLDDLSLSRVDQVKDDRWMVAFDTRVGPREVEVATELGELTTLTCNADRTKRPLRYVAMPR